MCGSRITEEQIIVIPPAQERGGATAEVCRRYAIGDATLCERKVEDGGMAVSDARRLESLEDQNARRTAPADRPDAGRRGAEGSASGRSRRRRPARRAAARDGAMQGHKLSARAGPAA